MFEDTDSIINNLLEQVETLRNVGINFSFCVTFSRYRVCYVMKTCLLLLNIYCM